MIHIHTFTNKKHTHRAQRRVNWIRHLVAVIETTKAVDVVVKERKVVELAQLLSVVVIELVEPMVVLFGPSPLD